MLGGRKITDTPRGETLEGSEDKGCPKRGILLPHICEDWVQVKS